MLGQQFLDLAMILIPAAVVAGIVGALFGVLIAHFMYEKKRSHVIAVTVLCTELILILVMTIGYAMMM